MKFGCLIDYDLKNCSSSCYGLTCETCFHKDDEKFEITSNACAYKISRHDVYEITKDLFDYTEITKENVMNNLLQFKGVYATPLNKEGKLIITKNINNSKHILRLLIPFKDAERDTYFVIVSSDNGYRDINDFYDYQELMYYLNKYRMNLG